MLSLLGKLFVILISVTLATGEVERVFVGFRGLDRIAPTQNQPELSFTQCDNYVLDSKGEENPRYTTLSVRPGESTYLNNLSKAVRGLFQYTNPAGNDLLILCTEDTIYKQSTQWTTLETGFDDAPWEGVLYADPNIYRLYLSNGLNDSKKFLADEDELFTLQNQDNETQITGTVVFVADSGIATADSTAIASLEAGQYIKSSTTASNSEWTEITTIESPNITFSTPFSGSSGANSSVVRSNDANPSRYLLEYEGHLIQGYIYDQDIITNVSNTNGTKEIQLYDAYGLAQSFEATTNLVSDITLRAKRGSGTTGNIILKIKTSLDTTDTLGTITYAVSNLTTTLQDVLFSFTSDISLTIGTDYWLTIEREDSDTSNVFFVYGDATYANGNMLWTYNSLGFDSNWNAGLTTIEASPSAADNDIDTQIKDDLPTSNGASATTLTIRETSALTIHPIIYYPNQVFLYDNNHSDALDNFSSVFLDLYGTSSGGDVRTFQIARILVSTVLGSVNWNTTDGTTAWTGLGCTGEGTDYSTTGTVEATYNSATPNTWITTEVTNISNDYATNNGLICHKPSNIIGFSSCNRGRPFTTWRATTNTGSSEVGLDLYFKLTSVNKKYSTINYSKRNFPENFPALNTFDIAGRVVGLAKTGGYLVIGGKNPDALHFYKWTGSVLDGEGIDHVVTKKGNTFGSSKSIAYPPMSDSFIFFSGLGVYLQTGLQTTSLSAQIREDAKIFSNYRDSEDYYGGFANLMPQGTILPTKDTYLLSTPNDLGVNSYIYGLNYANNTWVRWTDLYATALLTRASGGSEPQLYMGFNTGQVYTLDTTGSTIKPAILEFFVNGPDPQKDITKVKKLNWIEFGGRKDNPLYSSVLTLEVDGIDNELDEEYTRSITSSTTTDAMEYINFSPGKKAKEFKVKLTQVATTGAISWRSIRYDYTVNKTPGGK